MQLTGRNINSIIRLHNCLFLVVSDLTSSDLSGIKGLVNGEASNAHNPNNHCTVHSHHLRNNYLDRERLLPQH